MAKRRPPTLHTLLKDREHSESRAVATFTKRLESALAGLKGIKAEGKSGNGPRHPRKRVHPRADFLLTEVASLLSTQRIRDRAAIETEHQRKAQLWQLALQPPACDSAKLQSERSSVTGTEGHLSRWPTATSLLSPKARIEGVGTTEKRDSRLTSAPKDEVQDEKRTAGNAYIQELFILRKRGQRDCMCRLLDRERKWVRDLQESLK